MEDTGCSGGGGGWWNSWIQTAKETSAVALEFVKKDLSEFTATVQTDSKNVLTNVKENLNQDNVSAATQKAKDGVSSLLGGITKVLTVEAEDKHRPGSSKSASQPIFDRAKARLNAIQLDQGTYINDPSGSEEEFAAWLQTFNLDSRKGEISELLVINVEVRSLYTQLVPSMVSHADFWRRYFYKLHQLDEDEARRAALKKRAEDSSANLAWDDSEDDTDDWVDMSGPSSPPSDSHMTLNNVSKAAVHPQINVVQTPLPLNIKNTDHSLSQQSEQTVSVVTDSVMDRGSAETNSSSQTLQDVHKSDVKVVVGEVSLPSTNDSTSIPQSTHNVLDNRDQSSLNTTSIPAEMTDDSSKALNASCDTLTSSAMQDDKYDNVADKHESGSDGSLVIVKSDESVVKSDGQSGDEKAVETRVKGDLVVVGSAVSSDRTTPSPNSSNKELDDDDWDAEFDIEVTEEDIKLAQTAANVMDTNSQDDEWENWD